MKAYQTPALRIVTVELEGQLMDASVRSVRGNLTGSDAIQYNGGSTQAARVKGSSYDVWDDDWSN